MEYKYTLDDVIKELKERDMYVPSQSTLTTLITKNNFYARELATKESNGYINGEVTGKIWHLSKNGLEELISLTQKIRHRRTKEQMKIDELIKPIDLGAILATIPKENVRITTDNIEYPGLTRIDVLLKTDLVNYVELKAKALNIDNYQVIEELIEEDMKKIFSR